MLFNVDKYNIYEINNHMMNTNVSHYINIDNVFYFPGKTHHVYARRKLLIIAIFK